MIQNIPSKFNPFPVYYKNGSSPELPEPLTFEVLKDNSWLNLVKKGNPPGGGFKYKINNGDWQDFIFGQHFQLNTGDKISFRGTSNLLNSTDNDYYCFGYGGTDYPVTANFKVYGHINSMCNYSNELQTYQYCKLFSHDPRSYTWPHIVDASGVILPEYNDPDKSGVFRYLFAGQTALRCGPNVSGTVIATEGVGYMFYNCRSLTAAPSFEPTVAGKHSFYRTFAKCSNLIVPPQINVQEPLIAGASCIFKQMFSGCTSLTSTPYIPMQDVTLGSFQNMFAGCTSLISASELPASAINQQSYQGMFKGCTNLLSAPIMHFLRPATSGCQYMFSGCTNLKYINCQFVDWTKDANGTTMQYSFTDWVNGVQTTSGTFIKDPNLATEYRASRIPTNWRVINKDSLTFTAKSATANIALNKSGSPSVITLDYKVNNGDWTAYTTGTVINLNQNDTIAFSGNNDHFSKDIVNYYNFAMTGTIQAGGNIQSLMNYSNSVTSACYTRMFYGCTSLTTPPQLPATTLAEGCYNSMFYGCSNLSTAPQLSATTLARGCYAAMFFKCFSLSSIPSNYLPATTLAQGCYSQMFQECISLTSAPSLPATTALKNCYREMFHSCSSLLSAPALPATGLADYCYYGMFNGCSNLSSAPQLPVTTLTPYCYDSLFQDCHNLIVPPILPATTLAQGCYYYMFKGCTNLSSINNLPATTLANWCYYRMFFGCSNLSSINVSFTDWTQATNATTEWVYEVAANGTFICPTALGTQSTITRGVSNCPNNWTVVNK